METVHWWNSRTKSHFDNHISRWCRWWWSPIFAEVVVERPYLQVVQAQMASI